MQKRFWKALRPLRRKLTLERVLGYLCLGISGGAAAGAVLLFIAKFIYLREAAVWTAALLVCGGLIGIAAAIAKRPGMRETAKAGDALGFKQRFTTALELFEAGTAEASPIHELAAHDAAICAEVTRLDKAYRLRIPRKIWAVVICSGLFFLLAAMMPAPIITPDVIATRHMLEEFAEAEIKRLDDVKDDAIKNLSDIDAKAVEERLNQLAKDLRNAPTAEAQLKSMQEAQESLQSLANNAKSKDLHQLGQSLAQSGDERLNEAAKALGEAMQSADMQAINEQLQALSQALQSMSAEDRAALSAAMEELLADMPTSDLAQAAQAAMNSGATAEDIAALAEALSQAIAEGETIQVAVSALNQALSQNSAAARGNPKQGQQGQGQQGQGQQGQGQGQEGQQGEGQGQSEGQGQGEGQSQGQGQGQGEGQGEGQGQGVGIAVVPVPGGSGRGEGHIEDEQIYSRAAAGYRDYEAQITGEQNENGETVTQERMGFGEAGESVPYTDVYHDYKDEALRALEDGDIPHGMRELVKEYFTSLE